MFHTVLVRHRDRPAGLTTDGLEITRINCLLKRGGVLRTGNGVSVDVAVGAPGYSKTRVLTSEDSIATIDGYR